MHEDQAGSTYQDLLRQAYLLTGEPDRARQLAGRAFEAGRLPDRRYGPADAAEHTREELVRSFVAEPGRPPLAGASGAHTDVAAWHALHRLSPRRRAAIVLRYDEGLTEERTAARLGTSPQNVRADIDAALLTLRTALPGIEDPWMRVATALSAAGRQWSESARPAPVRPGTDILTSPRRSADPTGTTRPVPAGPPGPAPAGPPGPAPAEPAGTAPAGWPGTVHSLPVGPGPAARLRALPRPAIAAAAAAVVLLAVAVVVPALRDDPARPTAAGPPVPAGNAVPVQGARVTVPTLSVPRGLLDWPARGELAGDGALLGPAVAAWRSKVPAAEAPTGGRSLLWAGRLDGRTTVFVQALDRRGAPRVAQLSGAGAGSLRLQHAEPLRAGSAVLSILPAAGPAGPNRVLVSPEAQVADRLLASNPMSGSALRRITIGVDGISAVLPSPRGAPTCSRVVVLGLDSPEGGASSGTRVLQSGIVRADLLVATSMEVEVGTATLAAAQGASPETAWFADGARLAPTVPGRGTLVVAALGPRLAGRPLSGTDRRTVSSRAYELRRGTARYLGSVVELGGRQVCASTFPVGAAPAPDSPAGWVLRCPLPVGTAGVLHVVGGAGTDSVTVALDPTRAPAGQRPFAGTLVRPAEMRSAGSFAVLQVVPAGFPCGAGSVQAAGGGDEVAPLRTLPPYTP